MRFQDAARDARAVVYAGIQADPQVLRTADPARRCDARPTSPGAGGDERRDRRSGRLADDVPEPVRVVRDGRRRRAGPLGGDPRGVAGRRRPRRAGAQPGPRRAHRGGHGAAPREAGRTRRGSPRAADPVRRRPGRDPPLRRDGRTERVRRGIRLQVGCPRASTPTSSTSSTTHGRTPPTRTSGWPSRWSCSTHGDRATSGSPGRPRRTTGPPSSRSRRSTRSRPAAAVTAARRTAAPRRTASASTRAGPTG